MRYKIISKKLVFGIILLFIITNIFFVKADNAITKIDVKNDIVPIGDMQITRYYSFEQIHITFEKKTYNFPAPSYLPDYHSFIIARSKGGDNEYIGNVICPNQPDLDCYKYMRVKIMSFWGDYNLFKFVDFDGGDIQGYVLFASVITIVPWPVDTVQ